MLISFTRTLLLYVFIAIALRIMGKRQVGQLEPLELVVTILISELVAIPMQDLSAPLLAGVVPLVTILVVNVLASHLLLKSTKLRKWVVGKPSILIHEGKLDKTQLKKNSISTDEVIEALRLKEVVDIATVRYAILETNGQLSVILYPLHRPPTTAELHGERGSDGLPVVVISDGRWMDDNIKLLHLSRGWVEEQARQRGAHGIHDVFLMTVDEKRNIFIQTNEQSNEVSA